MMSFHVVFASVVRQRDRIVNRQHVPDFESLTFQELFTKLTSNTPIADAGNFQIRLRLFDAKLDETTWTSWTIVTADQQILPFVAAGLNEICYTLPSIQEAVVMEHKTAGQQRTAMQTLMASRAASIPAHQEIIDSQGVVIWKRVLSNDVQDLFSKPEFELPDLQVATKVIKCLTDAVWSTEGSVETMERALGRKIPTDITTVQLRAGGAELPPGIVWPGRYNGAWGKKGKVPVVSGEELRKHVRCMAGLLSQPWAFKDRHATVRSLVESVAAVYESFANSLDGKLLDVQANHASATAVRSVGDAGGHEVLVSIPVKLATHRTAQRIQTALDMLDIYEVCDITQHVRDLAEQSRKPFLDGLGFNQPAQLYTFRHANNHEDFYAVWKVNPLLSLDEQFARSGACQIEVSRLRASPVARKRKLPNLTAGPAGKKHKPSASSEGQDSRKRKQRAEAGALENCTSTRIWTDLEGEADC